MSIIKPLVLKFSSIALKVMEKYLSVVTNSIRHKLNKTLDHILKHIVIYNNINKSSHQPMAKKLVRLRSFT